MKQLPPRMLLAPVWVALASVVMVSSSAHAQPDTPEGVAVDPAVPAHAVPPSETAPPLPDAQPVPEAQPSADAQPAPDAQPGSDAATPHTVTQPAPTDLPCTGDPLPPPPRPQAAATPGSQQSYGAPPQQHWMDAVQRPFSFSVGFGPGALTLHGDDGTDSELGLNYQFRLGFGFARRWALVVSYEGTSVTRNDSRFAQDAFIIGVQRFVTQRFHIRGGFGFGQVSEDNDAFFAETGGGIGGALALGYDVVQGVNYAFSVELGGALMQYPDSVWSTGGLNLALSFF